jgi:glycosyltransferase involved in cell wall biosynthesis
MQNETIVVIIPYYNGSAFIERAIESVVAQTRSADEFIIVNDGSRDEERAFLAALAVRYPFTILDKANGGQGSARNAGVKASTSAFICFLDQDDFYLQNHIADLLAAKPEDTMRFGWVYADLWIADGDGKVIETEIVGRRGNNPKKSLPQMLGDDMYVLPSAALISREAFEAVGGFDEQFMGYEDDDLFIRIFREGFSNHFLPKPVTAWCKHGASTSFGIRMHRSRFRFFKKYVELCPDQPTTDVFFYRDHLYHRFQAGFVDEYFKSVVARSEHSDEIREIARESIEIGLASIYLPRLPRLYLLTMRYAIDLPVAFQRLLMRIAGKVATGF